MITKPQLNDDKQPLQIIMIDNFDSFTYNLVNQFRLIGAEVIIFRNDVEIDKIFTETRLARRETIIVLSPGPGNPENAGNTLAIIEQFAGVLPILGICLGHQSIVQHYGGRIVPAKQIVHGKADDIFLEACGIFEGISSPVRAARYHSLVATQMPFDLAVIARTKNEVMAVKHLNDKTLGFQFHPESILTTNGTTLLKAAIQWLTQPNQNICYEK